MHVRTLILLLLVAPVARAEEKSPKEELARTIHSLILPQIPKQHEDRSGWGQTIPMPANLRRPGLRRTMIKVGDRMELPQGTWVRTKVWFDDPARDVQLRVVDQRQKDDNKSRLVLEATIKLHGERQRQEWLRGLKLVDLTARADAVILATFDVDLTVELKAGKLLPELKVEPKVVKTKLELKEFDLQKLNIGAGPVQVETRAFEEEMRRSLEDSLKQSEPKVSDKVNEVLTKAAKDGKLKLFAPKP